MGPYGELETGFKYDEGKPMFRLLPPKALELVAQVLTYGANKYGPENWRHVKNAEERYLDAALRHLNKIQQREYIDPESGYSHLAHAICSLLYILELTHADEERESRL